jgi:hypothetical protein
MTGSVAADQGETFNADSFMTGNRLFDLCKPDAPACWNYVSGVADAVMLLEAFSRVLRTGTDRTAFQACIPSGVTIRQMVDIATRFLERHPQTRHTSGAALIMVALNEAFPCSSKPPAPN